MKLLNVLVVLTIAMLGVACTSSGPTQPKMQDRERAADLNFNLAMDYFRKGKLDEAKEKIDKSIEQNPRNARAQAVAGLLYDRLNDEKTATAHFERAIALDPKNAEVLNNYASFLCSKGKYERGEKLAMQATTDRLYKTPEFALLNAGNCAHNAGKLDRAEQHYRDALALQPHFAEALLQMADLEYRREAYLPARGFLERYMAEQKPSPRTLLLGVRIETGLGNRNGAQTYAQRLRSEYPQSAETAELANIEKQRG